MATFTKQFCPVCGKAPLFLKVYGIVSSADKMIVQVEVAHDHTNCTYNAADAQITIEEAK